MFCTRRSYTGAWIETTLNDKRAETGRVAPTQERGLKLFAVTGPRRSPGVAPTQERGLKPSLRVVRRIWPRRSYTGAWIETKPEVKVIRKALSRSYTGAWIETDAPESSCPEIACRSYTGAWIETHAARSCTGWPVSRSYTGAWIETHVCATVA